MVVAAVVGVRQLALAVNGAAEFAAPDHQRIVQQAALLQIGTSAAEALIGVAALAGDLLRAAFACWSQPRWKSWMNRTPRSASRRASRQLAANVPGFFASGP